MTYELRIFTNIRILLIAFVAVAGLLGAYAVFAQEEPDIEFPVAELENCANKEECKAYCDEIEHINQCVDFAERHGLMHGEELQEAKKVAHALSQGAQLPGGCQNKEECEAYCQEGSHIEECLAFAEAAGFMSPEELEEARRIAPLMARGEMPGGCRSKEECEAYCSAEANVEECATFFEAAGFITAEEAEMFRKTGGRGPGGCQGREECDAYCNDPANQKACFEFAKQHDLIPEEEVQNLEEGIQRFKEGFHSAPPEVAQCLRDTVGEDVLAKIEAGTFLPNREVGEHMRQCFERHLPDIIEHDIREQIGEQAPPEAVDCVQRILGDARELQGPPTPEQEQRIREECFPASPTGGAHEQPSPEDFDQFPPPDGDIPEAPQGEFQLQSQEEYQRQYQEQFEKQYEEEFQRRLQQQQEPAPEAGLPGGNFLGAVWEAMKPALKRFIPSL